jgi:hypothetical protein
MWLLDLGCDVARHLETDFLLRHLRLAPGFFHGSFLSSCFAYETLRLDESPGAASPDKRKQIIPHLLLTGKRIWTNGASGAICMRKDDPRKWGWPHR